ncbi:hypothetical protein evm_001912 [Chilo suppressalis]|nr:hypothetical protein evm_001912 [Chilo suppressalis]
MEYVPMLLLTFSMQYSSARLNFYTEDNTPQMLSTKFVPRVTVKMCLLKPDMGPCRGNLKMYYFDPDTKSCSTFHWGGCQGNGNRFDSKLECEDTCLTKPDEPKKRPRYCSLTFDYGFCFGAVKRWYYDKLWKVCKERIYSGCGGNKNNFYSMEQAADGTRTRTLRFLGECTGHYATAALTAVSILILALGCKAAPSLRIPTLVFYYAGPPMDHGPNLPFPSIRKRPVPQQ